LAHRDQFDLWYNGCNIDAKTEEFRLPSGPSGGRRYPAKYGLSDVQTFIVIDDVAYERDLGARTQQDAEKIQKFNPGESWTKPE
jgi:hypothetical protein